MAGRRTRKIGNEQDDDVDTLLEAAENGEDISTGSVMPTQIAKIRFSGLASDAPKNGSVTDYLEHYTKRSVEFWNPLTQSMEQRPAAEVIALQMVIAALHGDKSATNRLIERTEGKVSVSTPAPAAIAQGKSARELAEQVERERQDDLRAAAQEKESSIAAIGRTAMIGHNSAGLVESDPMAIM